MRPADKIIEQQLSHFPTGTVSKSAKLPNGQLCHWFQCGSGPPAILLHGFPELPQSYSEQLKVLSAEYTVIAPHLRGYGGSGKPAMVASYSTTAIASDIIELATLQDWQGYHLVGHDWGGTVAWEIAMTEGSQMKTVTVLNSCPARLLMRRFVRSGQARRSWYMFLFQLPYLAERRFRKATADSVRDLFLSAAHNKSVFADKDLSAYVSMLRDPEFGGVHFYRAAIRRRLPSLRHVSSPAQLIWGLQDPALGPHIAQEDLYADWTDTFTIHRIPNAGHWVQQEAPEEVNGLLLRFWKQYD